jgi:nucleoside-diphosphate-sugar epimerase
VLEYAQKLAEKLGKKIEPEIPGIYRLGDARCSVSSVEKLKGLGWEPRRSLEEILQDFVTWVCGIGNVQKYYTDAHQQLLTMDVLRRSHAQ